MAPDDHEELDGPYPPDQEHELELQLELIVGEDEAGLTVLQLLGDHFPDVATADLRELVRLEGVLRSVGGQERPTGAGQTLQPGERLQVFPDGLPRIAAAPLRGLSFVYEDDDLLVCNKPAGVAVEAKRGEEARPFRAALLHHLRQTGQAARRPRIVHRLDQETSGVIVVAKHRAALTYLTALFETRDVAKTYVALVEGTSLEDGGEIDQPLGPRAKRGRSRDPSQLKPARSRWQVLERFRSYTLVQVEPLTGRQHQVRQHLSLLGLPIVGDGLYGKGKPLLLSDIKQGSYNKGRGREEKPLLARMGLHARRLAFVAPSGAQVQAEAELPKDFETSLSRLRKYDPRW